MKEVYGSHVPEQSRGRYDGPTSGETREVGIPALIRAQLRDHLLSTVGPSQEAFVFAVSSTPAGAPFNHSNFYRGVFGPTVKKLWPPSRPAAHFAVSRPQTFRGFHARGLGRAASRHAGDPRHRSAALTNEVYTHVAHVALDLRAAMDAAGNARAEDVSPG